MSNSSINNRSPLTVILQGAAYLAGAQAMRIAIRAIYIVALARFLGPELFGLFSYGISWYLAFMSLTFLGFDLILGRGKALSHDEFEKLIGLTFQIQLVMSSTAAVLSAIFALLVEERSLSLVLCVFSVALVTRSIAAWAGFVFAAKQQASSVFWMESTCRVLEAVVGTAVLLSGGGLIEVAIVHASSWSIQGAWALYRLSIRRYFPTRAKISSILNWLRGAPLVLGSAGIAQVWIGQAPLIMFRILGGDAAQMGQIALAFQLFALLAGVSWAALRAVLPELSRSVSEGRSGDRRFADLLCRFTILGLGAATVFTYVLGAPILDLIVGSAYRQAYAYLPYVVAFAAVYTLAVGAHQILASHDEYTTILIGTAAGAVVMTFVMVMTWDWGETNAPFIALGSGLLAWVVIVGWKVYDTTRFHLLKSVVTPLAVASFGIITVAVF